MIEFAGFGSSVAAAGDVNGDGRSDILVGDPNFELFAGRVFVFSGLDQSELLRVDDTASSVGFGTAVAGAGGDVNGDGTPDLLVGDPNGNGLGGSVFVLSGATGAELLRLDGAGGGFGRSVASAGSVNADGLPDVLVGAKDASPGSLTSAGSAFVLAPEPGLLLLQLVTVVALAVLRLRAAAG